MESYNLPEENEVNNVLEQSAPVRSWRDLLHEILAPTGPEDADEENDDDDE